RGRVWSAVRLGQALLIGAVGAAGCQAIAGIEDRHFEEPLEAGAMKKPARPKCTSYCKDITDTCIEENAQYASEEACLDVCGLIPEGEDNELKRFTVACRQMQVESAMIGEKSDACFGAGPGGAKACGSDC